MVQVPWVAEEQGGARRAAGGVCGFCGVACRGVRRLKRVHCAYGERPHEERQRGEAGWGVQVTMWGPDESMRLRSVMSHLEALLRVRRPVRRLYGQ